MVTSSGSLVHLQTNITGVCGERSQCLHHTGLSPRSRPVCFPRLHCSGSRLLFRELSKAGPELCALPRSKPVRFRFSGAPQRPAFVPFPGVSGSGEQVLGEHPLLWCGPSLLTPRPRPPAPDSRPSHLVSRERCVSLEGS